MDSRKITDPLNRGMVGGLLGMPADMLNMLRNGGRSVGNLANRLAGVNAPPATMVENPVYGQEWWGDKMQKAGYVSPNRNKLAEFGAGLLDPGSVMTDVPMLAKGLFGLGDPATTKMLGGLLGATVWHGSPHKFDKFDSSKIGTGEGAQAYGHGLYLAESPEVAKSYQSALSADRGFSYGGKTGLTRAEVQDMVNAKYGGGYLDGVIRPSGVADSFIDDMVTGTGRAEGAYPRQYKPGSQRAKIYDELRGQIQHADPGHLYKVDLPDSAISKMLDWDKPLSQQPKAVRKAVEPIVAPIRKEMAKPTAAGWGDFAAPQKYDPTGAEVLALLRQQKDSGAQGILGNGLGPEVSQRLRDAGIPGIRYLDGGSRGTGQGSSNFVVFPGNENRLKILERNGQPLK